MSVSKRLRYEVLRRDNYTCRYCGRSAPEVKLTIDHVTPTALGGKDEPGNLVTACADCNGGKSSVPPDAAVVDDVSQDAIRWARAQKVAAEKMLADLDARNAIREDFLEAWNRWGHGEGNGRKTVPLPTSWVPSIENFITAGLPLEVLLDCVDIAMRADKVNLDNRFRYMCGIAWNKVAEMQDLAREHVDDDEVDGFAEAFADFEDPWNALPREELQEHVWRFELLTEQFLKALPVFVHERAERAADHDWACAGEPDAARLKKLPDVLRHVGNVLAECEIEPRRVEVD